MKSLIFVCALLFVTSSRSESDLYPRGCIYIVGRCFEECPVGTHAYALGCGYKTPEPTCREQNPVTEEHMICDYSDCYCNPPTIRDEKTNKCVLKEDCSPQTHVDPPKPTLLPPFEEFKPDESTPEAPKAEVPKPEAPKAEVPKPEAPKSEAPQADAPKSDAPKSEAPKPEAPQSDEPKPEASKPEVSKAKESA